MPTQAGQEGEVLQRVGGQVMGLGKSRGHRRGLRIAKLESGASTDSVHDHLNLAAPLTGVTSNHPHFAPLRQGFEHRHSALLPTESRVRVQWVGDVVDAASDLAISAGLWHGLSSDPPNNSPQRYPRSRTASDL